MVKSALQSLWNDTCTVYEYHEVIRKNKSTGYEEVLVYENIPCRISFEMLRAARKAAPAYANAVRVKLFCPVEIDIRPGSKIVVSRNGKELIYKNSGLPSIYESHREILLTQFDGWA